MTAPDLLTRDTCEALMRRVLELVTASRAHVELSSMTSASAEFARGEIHVTSLTRSFEVALTVGLDGRQAMARTNQIDEAGLRALVARVEGAARENRTPGDLFAMPPRTYAAGPTIAFATNTVAMEAEAQAVVVDRAIEAAEGAGLVAAGDVHLDAYTRAARTTNGFLGYETTTFGQFSMTARDEERHGSGWAWSGYEDWARVDTAAVIRHAIDVGARSVNPVAIEPGRYTVILEPSAVAALIEPIIGHNTRSWGAWFADGGQGVFAKEPVGTNKIGLQMLDRRLSMVASPWDPERPASTIGSRWTPIPPTPVTWFERGVLRNLAYDEDYARPRGRSPVIDPGGVRLSAEGPAQTLDEMIAAVRRGVWVNRFSDVVVMDGRTLLLTGTTRDGTFLIENGKITKPIRNFRFTESPFFALNQLEAWGEPVRASRAVVAPRLKLRDFNFSSVTNAI